jgi:hypothetical protein
MRKNNGSDSMMQSQQARAQNLKKWRESRLHEETLPSGLHVLLRDVDLPGIVFEGNVPNTLIDVITSQNFQEMSEEQSANKLLAENKTDFAILMFELIKAALVDPAIGEKADDQHILYGELTLTDKMHIFNFMNREVQSVRPFRRKPEKSSEPA